MLDVDFRMILECPEIVPQKVVENGNSDSKNKCNFIPDASKKQKIQDSNIYDNPRQPHNPELEYLLPFPPRSALVMGE